MPRRKSDVQQILGILEEFQEKDILKALSKMEIALEEPSGLLRQDIALVLVSTMRSLIPLLLRAGVVSEVDWIATKFDKKTVDVSVRVLHSDCIGKKISLFQATRAGVQPIMVDGKGKDKGKKVPLEVTGAPTGDTIDFIMRAGLTAVLRCNGTGISQFKPAVKR